MKTYFVRQTKHQLGHYSSNKVIFKKRGMLCGLSLMRIRYNLTNSKNRQEIEKILNILKL